MKITYFVGAGPTWQFGNNLTLAMPQFLWWSMVRAEITLVADHCYALWENEIEKWKSKIEKRKSKMDSVRNYLTKAKNQPKKSKIEILKSNEILKSVNQLLLPEG